MGVPIKGDFDSDTKTLTVRYKTPQEQSDEAVQGSTCQGGTTALRLGSTDFNLEKWLASLQAIRNPQHIQQAPLPLQVCNTVQGKHPLIIPCSLVSGHAHYW